MSSGKAPWWKKEIIYQIYPRSFMDENDDGIGDLKGIIQKLDYIKSLNVGCIWLSPIYTSPMYDFGYDVADYRDIDPIFGNMADFGILLEEVHKRGMKLMLDFVPNHTSIDHPWFIESRSSKNNPKRDWYFWKDPKKDGTPPNNWLSYFGGPAWTFDETTGQYYFHQFVPEQPELNYENPKVRDAMVNNMKFWLDKGVDAFRMDTIFLLKKDQRFLDHPVNDDWDGVFPIERLHTIYTADVEGTLDFIKIYRDLLDQYEDRIMLGEIYLPIKDLIKYFEHIELPMNSMLLANEWNAKIIADLIRQFEKELPKDGWPNYQLGNHDNHRVATRLGEAQARVATMLNLTLRGTPITYYGEEIGMLNGEIPFDKIQDPPALNVPEMAHKIGRDPERTPMQWNTTANAGFSSEGIETWLPVASTYNRLNVEVQENEPNSNLNYYRAISKLRKEEPSLLLGELEIIDTSEAENAIGYVRYFENSDKFLVMLNFSDQDVVIKKISNKFSKGTLEVSAIEESISEINFEKLVLRGNQAMLIRIK